MKTRWIKVLSLVMLGLIPCVQGINPLIKSVYAATTTNTTVYLPGVEKNLTTGETNKYYSVGGATLQRHSRGDLEKLYYLFPDHLSSTKLVIDKDKTETSYLSYYPYGNTRTYTNPNSALQNLYTGQKQDQETNLYYYNARYYNPTIGHFISADSAEGPNRYAYVRNNPVMKNDPSGNYEVSNYLSQAWSSFATPISQDWQYLWGGYGNIGERSVAALDLLTLGGFRSTTSAVNDYVTVNALANQQGLSMFDPARVVVAANAGIQATSFAADIVGFGQTARAVPASIKGLSNLRTASALKKYINSGLEMIRGGDYDSAITHFRNPDEAKKFGFGFSNSATDIITWNNIVEPEDVAYAAGEVARHSHFGPSSSALGEIKVSNVSAARQGVMIAPELRHNVSLVHAEEWTHAYQKVAGFTGSGAFADELDVAAYFARQNVPLTDLWLNRYGRAAFLAGQ